MVQRRVPDPELPTGSMTVVDALGTKDGWGGAVPHIFDYRPYGGPAGTMRVETDATNIVDAPTTAGGTFPTGEITDTRFAPTVEAPNASGMLQSLLGSVFVGSPSTSTEVTFGVEYDFGKAVGDHDGFSTTGVVSKQSVLQSGESASIIFSVNENSHPVQFVYYSPEYSRLVNTEVLPAYAGGSTPNIRGFIRTPGGSPPDASFSFFGFSGIVGWLTHDLSQNFVSR